MKVKKIKLASELKEYEGRQGFFVRFVPASKLDNSDEIDDALTKVGVVSVAPEVVYDFQGAWFFIYPEDTYFDIHLLYEIGEGEEALHAMRWAGAKKRMWQLWGLEAIIKEL